MVIGNIHSVVLFEPRIDIDVKFCTPIRHEDKYYERTLFVVKEI
jgi:hypothetical protein